MLRNRKLGKLVGFMAGAGLALALASGCGGDDDGGKGGSSGAFGEKCSEVCQLQTDGGCSLLETGDCIEFCRAFEGAGASCRAALEATMDCQIAGGSASACSSDACQTEMDAQGPACGS